MRIDTLVRELFLFVGNSTDSGCKSICEKLIADIERISEINSHKHLNAKIQKHRAAQKSMTRDMTNNHAGLRIYHTLDVFIDCRTIYKRRGKAYSIIDKYEDLLPAFIKFKQEVFKYYKCE